MAVTAAQRQTIRHAIDVGLPQDTLLRFAQAGYLPQAKQLQFHANCRKADNSPNALDLGYGGARGGGKTHCAFAQIAIDDCQRIDNLKVLFLRKVGRYAKESLEDLRRTVLKRIQYDFKGGVFHYPNGSRIIAGSYQYEKDIDNYLSLEYDIILIEQAEQLSKSKIDSIKTVNRTSKQFRPRMYYTFNPGGIGHAYLKQRFIVPWRTEKETDTSFVFATVDDNEFVNPEYRKTLEGLTGWQKAAWLHGDWDIFAGQYFSNLRYDVHVTKPFKILDEYPVWASMDYGFNHPTTVHLFTRVDGITYCIAEYSARKRLVAQHAPAIHGMLERLGISSSRLQNFVAGQDLFAQRGTAGGKTIAEEYGEHGLVITAANNDRIAGASHLLKLIGDVENKIDPKIKFFDTCQLTVAQLHEMQHNPNSPEDVLKTDIDDDGNGGDDLYDSLRYGVMTATGTGVWL